MGEPKYSFEESSIYRGLTSYRIVNKNNEVCGYIEWWEQWRQWVVTFTTYSRWTQDCLQDVTAFIASLGVPDLAHSRR
jgi:hypothetical protein